MHFYILPIILMVMNRKIDKYWHKNFCINYHTHSEIILCNNKRVEVARAKIDLADVGKVLKYKWHINWRKDGTTKAVVCGTPLFCSLHKFILGTKVGYIIDHKNGDTLDNRRCNLRFATYRQNSRNKKARGTEYHRGMKRWRAYIQIDGKNIYRGWFDTEKEARDERLKLVKKYFGEFARV